MSPQLEALIGELDSAAARLRAGELDPGEAADLVERCAELAGRIGSELDRAAREAELDRAGGEAELEVSRGGQGQLS